ncbi:cysteine desulfurase family protein [Candidatus Paracaedibacter symbiosus]|uniref:cysteine desulfurase family protein n=1 Tax=Candidatus Paracaedibacter symbiosus TaxID=244582 RepID=UPI00068A9E3D|nr:cysteine desulfurase family protein [Candidatus Paracaedibacter symbiosus]
MSPIYLDHNATTPLCWQAKQAMLEILDVCGNASSTHNDGRRVRQYVEKARAKVADYFAVTPAQVVFTSGATEANNLVLKGFNGPVITSAIEHDSVLKARNDLTICPVTAEGIIDLEALETELQQVTRPCLVSVMAANNETGVMQPLQEIVGLCRKYQALMHSDAVQVVGKIDFDWQQLGLDYISLSAHKIGGPQGVGALVVNPNRALRPQITGGGQERYFRAGTENVLGIVGLGAAIEACRHNDWIEVASLRQDLEASLRANFKDIAIFGAQVPRLPNTVNLTMPGVVNTVQVMHFDLNSISLSAGSACSSGKVKPSHVLQAMGVDGKDIDNSIRISLGLQTTQVEIQHFIETWENLYYRTHGGEQTRRIKQ